MVLIRLSGCTGWSGPLLFAYGIRHVFAWPGPYDVTKAKARQWKIETVWVNAWQNQQNDVLPAKTDQPVYPSSLIEVLAVRMKKPWILSSYVVQSEHSNEAGWMSWLFWVFAVVTGLYAPNFFEVDGAYRFRVVASVWPEPCMLGFWNFIYGFLTEKYLTHFFFLVQVISFSGVMLPLKKSDWNLMHAISYEPCMLGFWNFVYGFLMETQLTSIFFLSKLSPFLELCPFEKNQNGILSARYLEKYLSQGLETWSADRGWWVDYLIKLKKKIIIFFRSYGPLKIWAF